MNDLAGREYEPIKWTRKVGHGWKQPLTIGLGGLISSIIIIGVGMVLTDHVSRTLFVILIMVLAFTLLCSAAGFSFLLSKDYYIHMAQILLGKRKIPSDDMVRFIERFLKDNGIPWKGSRHGAEYKWTFTGGKKGHIFMITDDTYGLMLGIRDRNGKLMELVQTFVIEANVEFDLAPKEEWNEGYLD